MSDQARRVKIPVKKIKNEWNTYFSCRVGDFAIIFLTNLDDDWKNNSVSGTMSLALKTRHNAMKATKQNVNKILK